MVIPFAYAGTWSDDFSDGNISGWLPSNPMGGNYSWEAVDGVLVGERQSEWTVALSLEDGNTWQDYTVELDVRFLEALHAEYTCIGVVCHFSGPTRYMYTYLCHRFQKNMEVLGGCVRPQGNA